MKANRRCDTRPEMAVRSELFKRGLRFRVDLPVEVDGRSPRPDIVFTRSRVAVFIDGCFWHRCPEHFRRPKSNQEYWDPKIARNVERDRQQDQRLKRAGWKVLRVWEHEPPEEAADRICAELDR